MTAEQTTSPNTDLEDSLEGAFNGQRAAVERFFRALLAGPLFVPERYQAQPLSDSPRYPNDFINILGIQDSDRVIVPAFSDPALIEEWCGTPMSYKTCTGPEVAEMLPEEWWMIINPGSEIIRELTPWEVSRLKDGDAALDELLHEAYSDMAAEPIRVRPLADGEFADSVAALTLYCKENESLLRLFLLVEEGEASDGTEVSTLLIGAALSDSIPGSEYSNVQSMLDSYVAPTLIGGQQKKIFVGGDSGGNVMLGMFKDAEPVFNRTPEKRSLTERLGSLLKK
jgi:hypothetical protein